LVSKVILCNGLQYKIYCEVFAIDIEGKKDLRFKISGLCEDSRIQVNDEDLQFFELKSILKLLIVKDVTNPLFPIKCVRLFDMLCKFFIFPFIQITQGTSNGVGNTGTNREDSIRTGSVAVLDSAGGSNPHNGSLTAGEKQIEIWGRAPGILP